MFGDFITVFDAKRLDDRKLDFTGHWEEATDDMIENEAMVL
jgi:hypothetical protein